MGIHGILVTGGAGFVGANFVLDWLRGSSEPVINLDKLTYAGNLDSLSGLRGDARHVFVRGDIGDQALLESLLDAHRPRAIVNFAAESHVDRSIHGAGEFVQTNLVGTFRLLEAARGYWGRLPVSDAQRFRFLHVSTDEVYGSLSPTEASFRETTAYSPNSPYSASKAGADYLVRAWHQTYGLPTLTTNCSNNYGPLQFPEKLIPLMILNASQGKPLPVYGDGRNVRDWLHVADHCAALREVLARGRAGEVYNIGGESERQNIEVVQTICDLLDDMLSASAIGPRRQLITFVKDRPGHDRRYAVDCSKVKQELGWRPQVAFDEGLRRTVRWYLDNGDWVRGVQTGDYQRWMQLNYSPERAA